jgi:molybdopterin converting factor small subunit
MTGKTPLFNTAPDPHAPRPCPLFAIACGFREAADRTVKTSLTDGGSISNLRSLHHLSDDRLLSRPQPGVYVMKKAHISLKLYATLANLKPDNADRFGVEPNTTVGQLADALGVPLKEMKLIFINGRKCGLDTLLKDGDRVGIFPPVGGG